MVVQIITLHLYFKADMYVPILVIAYILSMLKQSVSTYIWTATSVNLHIYYMG